MFDLILKPHKEISQSEITEIINIKSKAWPYSFDSQLEWIDNNLKATDIHVLLSSNGEYVAYLNLIDIEIKLDNNIMNGYGIGNVCAAEKGKGYGSKIIESANEYLLSMNRIGLLFCKDHLVDFYKRYGWEIIEPNKISSEKDFSNINVMISNYHPAFTILTYNLSLF